MSLGTAMEAAVGAHVGQVATEAVPEEQPTYRDLRRLFGSNADITAAAGYGKPGQYARGSAGWKRRRTFMRNLQRYEQGRVGGPGERRRPKRLEPRLSSIARREQRRQATPRSVRDVIRLMGREGTTTSLVKVKFAYSSAKNPQRNREIEVRVFTSTPVYREVEWPMRGRSPRSEGSWSELGEQYLEAWAIAYGMPGELVATGVDDEEDPVFQFDIGRGEGVQYAFG